MEPCNPSPCWSSILQKKPPTKPQDPISTKVFANCRSSNPKGISVAVVDANAVIHGDKLVGVADKFVTINEVLDEVRDPVSRQRLTFLPLNAETMEPSSESIKKVVRFARETGDLQTLSDVDLKLIALTYELESQIHGTNHLRENPPPLHVVNVKNLPEAQMPGWGSNVPNLAEWEALEHLSEGGLDEESRILPLKDLNDNVVPLDGSVAEGRDQDDKDQTTGRMRRFPLPKKEMKIDGKKMVADGIDASLGEDTDWMYIHQMDVKTAFLNGDLAEEIYMEQPEGYVVPGQEHKFSLPLPQGGRDVITKNLILSEDQLPRKLLYPKTKKKPNKQDQDFLCFDDIFTHAGEERAPLRPPVGQALAVFSGKRNPNDNHFSHSKH